MRQVLSGYNNSVLFFMTVKLPFEKIFTGNVFRSRFSLICKSTYFIEKLLCERVKNTDKLSMFRLCQPFRF